MQEVSGVFSYGRCCGPYHCARGVVYSTYSKSRGPLQRVLAVAGGFVYIDESSAHAAKRELGKETGGAELGYREQPGTYDVPDRGPREGGICGVASWVTWGFFRGCGSDVAGGAKGWPVSDLEGIVGRPTFNHSKIVSDGVERACRKLEYTTLATSVGQAPFTMGDLRRVYAAVRGGELHPANFRRKVLSTPGFAVPTGNTTTVGRGRHVHKRCGHAFAPTGATAGWGGRLRVLA